MTYIFTRGKEGSTFGERIELSMDETWPPEFIRLKSFLRHNLGIHDMAWTYDDGTCWVVKRKFEVQP